MNEKQKMAACEAILFTMGDAVETADIAKALDISREETLQILSALQEAYRSEERGMELIALEDSWQLCTKKEYYEQLIRIAMHPKKPVLTDVMLETLAIIAYKQPVTRQEIEKIRGVKCDHAVNRLIEYDLIKELGRLDAPGRPIVFGTTEEFLRIFGVSALDELPLPDPVKRADFLTEAEEEVRLKIDV